MYGLVSSPASVIWWLYSCFAAPERVACRRRAAEWPTLSPRYGSAGTIPRSPADRSPRKRSLKKMHREIRTYVLVSMYEMYERVRVCIGT